LLKLGKQYKILGESISVPILLAVSDGYDRENDYDTGRKEGCMARLHCYKNVLLYNYLKI
jgi:hypothetical protein